MVGNVASTSSRVRAHVHLGDVSMIGHPDLECGFVTGWKPPTWFAFFNAWEVWADGLGIEDDNYVDDRWL